MSENLIDVTEAPDAVRVKVLGEVPLTAAEAFDRALVRVSVKRPQRVLLDLSSMTAISSMVMGVLVNFHRAITRAGGTLTLVAVPPLVRTALERAGLHRVFEFVPATEGAAPRPT